MTGEMMCMEGPGTASTAPVMVNTWMRGADMAKPTCSVPVCDRPSRAIGGGLCNAHRHWAFMHGGEVPSHRIREHGSLNRLARLARPLESGCIAWTGFRDAKGYGRTGSDRDTGERMAHRLAWVIEHGPIPPGLQVDHLCRNTSCVNPGHMELVTASENGRRRWKATR